MKHLLKKTEKILLVTFFALQTIFVQAQIGTYNPRGGTTKLRTQTDVTNLGTAIGTDTIFNGNINIGYVDCCASRQTDITDLSPLRNIVRITGNLNIQQNGHLANLNGLDSLQTIGGLFSVQGNRELTDLGDFPVLQSIGGYFYVRSNSELTDLGDFPVLQSIGGYFYVRSNSELTDLGDFPVLQTIGGYFRVKFNFELTDLGDFPVLQSIGGFFSVYENAELTTLGDFPVLQSIGGNFNVQGNSKLTDLEYFPALQSIGKIFNVYENTELTTLGDFPVLQTIGKVFSVYENTELTTLGDFPALQTIGGFNVHSNDSLTDLGDFPGLQTIRGAFNVYENTELTTLGNFPGLQTIEGIFNVYENTELTTLGNFPVLQSIGGEFAGGFVVTRNDQLTTLGDFPVLDSIGGHFYVVSNDTLTTLGNFSSLTSIGVGHYRYIPSLDETRNYVSIVVENNSSLSNCCVLAPFFNIENTGVEGDTFITNNAAGCEDKNTIQNTCQSLIITTKKVHQIAHDNIDPLPIGFIVGGVATGWTSEITYTPTQANFITLSSEENTNQTGAITITATPMENMGFERTATIMIMTKGDTSDAVINMIIITQAGYPPYKGDVVLTTQAEVNAIRTTLGDPRIFVIEGNLTIGPSNDITNLDSLYFLTEVTGNISVMNNFGLVNAGNFPFLQKIEGNFSMLENGKLEHVGSFPSLVGIGGYFSIKNNDNLRYLYDFPALTSIDSVEGVSIEIKDNDLLTYCCILTNFMDGTHQVSGSIDISDNAMGCNEISEVSCAPFIDLSEKRDTLLPFVSSDFDFTVSSNRRWKLSPIADWVTLSVDSGGIDDVLTYTSVTITPLINTIAERRTATIKLTTIGHGGTPDSVLMNIIQEAAPQIRLANSYTDRDTIDIAYDNNDARPILIAFTVGGSATGWEISITYIPESTNFITLDPLLRNDQKGDITTMAIPSPNTNNEKRTAVITLSTRGHEGTPASDTLTIIQEAAPMIMLTSHESDANINIAHNATVSIPIEFTLDGSATGWESDIIYMPENTGFIDLSEQEEKEDTSVIKIIPSPNTTTVSRTAKITLITTGQLGTPDSVSLMITQEAAPKIDLASHTDGEIIAIAYDNNNDTDPIIIKFTLGGSATGWESDIIYMPENTGFIDLSEQEKEEDTRVIKIIPSINDTTVSRTAMITLKTMGQRGDPASVIFTITQEAAPTIMLTSPPDGNTISIAHDDNIVSIPIKFTVGGSATGWESEISYMPDIPENMNFITLDTTMNDNQTGPITIMASPMKNAGVERTATITLRTTGQKGDPVSVSLKITQEISPTIELTSYNEGSDDSFLELKSDGRDTIAIAYDATDSITINFTVGGSATDWESNVIYMPENDTSIMISQHEGTDGNITITPSANTSAAPRTATITLKTAGHEGTPDSVLLTVTQESIPTIELISNDSHTIIHDATASIPIEFTIGGSATGWESDITDNPFISLSLNKGTGQTGEKITIMVIPMKNTGVIDRTDTITLSTMGQTGTPARDTFTITQKAAPAIMLTDYADGENVNIAHDDTNSRTISFTLGGSATGWESEITGDPFISLSSEIGTNGNITLTPSANDTTKERTATITLRTTGPGQTPDSVSLMITQEASPKIDLASHTDGEIIAIAYDNNNDTDPIIIKFTLGGSATGWESDIIYTSENTGFIDLSEQEKEEDRRVIKIIPSINDTTVSRTAMITLKTMGQKGDPASAIFTITQEAVPTIMLTSPPDGNTISIAHDDNIASIPITFNVGGSATGWESEISYMPDIPENMNFITLDKTMNDNQTGPITIMASPMKNAGVERTATITLRTTGQKGDPVSVSLKIAQEISPTIELTSYNEGSDDSFLELKSDGRDTIAIAYDATDSITINFTVGGSAAGWESYVVYMPENDTSIMISQHEGTDGNITITPSINTSAAPRTATITLKTAGHEGTPDSVLLTVTQEAIPTIELISNDSHTIIHDATASIPIEFTIGGSATGWESDITDNPFISLSLNKGTGQTGEKITIMVSPMKNTGVIDRTDTITLSTMGQTGTPARDTFTITQKAAPAIMLTDYADGENVNIAHDDTIPRTISFALGGSATGWESDITGDPFISLSSEIGTNGNITLTPSVNTSTEPRTATITLRTTGPGQTPDSVSLMITQEAIPAIMLSSYNGNPFPSDGNTIVIAHDHTNSITIDFVLGGSAKGWKSSITYPIGTSEEDKFINSSLKKDGTDPNIIIPIKDMNTTPVSRTATITLSTTGHLDGGVSDSILLTITQEGAPVLELTSDNISRNPKDTASIPIEFTVGGSATGWESEIRYAPAKDTFITLSPKDSIDQTGPITIMASPMENTDIKERTATITLRTTGQKGDPASVSLTITQTALPNTPMIELISIDSISIDSISIAHDDTIPKDINFTVGGSAGGWESKITYMPDIPKNNDFIKLNPPQNDAKGSITIEATSSVNEDTIPRTATITLSTTGHDGDAVSVSLIITQEAKPVLKLTSNDNDTIAHDAINSIPIHFNVGGSARGWESEITYTPSDANFVTLSSEESMDQTGPITIMASPSTNTDLKKRTATIILSTEGNGASVKDTLTITQAAAPEIKMTTSHTNGENIKIAHNDTEPIPLNFTLKGSASSYMRHINYTPENADFIIFEFINSSGDTRDTQIMPSANTTTEPRTATIRLKTTGHEGTPDSVSLTITQEAMPVIELISKETDTIIHDATDSIPINFTVGGSAKGWISVNSNSDFITLSPKDSITQTGNITIMASPTENTDNKDRIATITLSTTGQIGTPASAVFTIIQKAKPTIILRDRNNSSIQKDHTTPIVIRFTVGGSAQGWTSHIDYMPDSANFIRLNPPNNDDQIGKVEIEAKPSANTSIERSATIILITAGHEGTPDSVSFTITQDAGAEPLLGVAPSKPFTLYPNPTTGTLTIEGVTGYLQMYIYDLVGREVMTYSLTPSKKTIDVSDLPSGMYVVTLRGKDKTWTEVLIIVN